MAADRVRVLALRYADPGGNCALRQTKAPAPKLRLDGDHFRHVAAGELMQTDDQAIQFGEKWDLAGRPQRRLAKPARAVGSTICRSARIAMLPRANVAAFDAIAFKLAG